MVFEAAGAEHEPSEQHGGAGPVRGRVDLSYQVPGSVVQVAIEWGERKHVVAVGGAAAPLASKAEFEAVVIGTVHLLLAGRGDAEFASLGDPVEVAERVAALVPSPHPMSQLGPFYTTRAVRTWLGITRQALDQRVRDRKVLEYRYNSFAGTCALITWNAPSVSMPWIFPRRLERSPMTLPMNSSGTLISTV